MPFFIAALLGGLVEMAASALGRWLLSLGVSFIAYKGISALTTWAVAQVFSNLNGLPAELLGVLGSAGVGTAINIVASAYSVRLIIGGLTNDTIKKAVLK